MNKESFVDLLENYLNKYKNASCLAGSDADGFIEKMYENLIKDAPFDVNQWLKINMENRFLYAVEPPKWTKRGEKDWPYFEDEPMIFLHQFSLDVDAVKKMHRGVDIPVGRTIYVFGKKKKVDEDGWIAVYMMVGQDNINGSRISINHIETTM